MPINVCNKVTRRITAKTLGYRDKTLSLSALRRCAPRLGPQLSPQCLLAVDTTGLLHVQHIFTNSLIFSSPEGYWFQFSIPRAYFVYTVRHCTGQHCSSIYACTYRLFASMWCPLLSVTTTLYYVVKSISHHRTWYHALSLHCACIRSSGIILIPWATFLPNFVSFVASTAELAHREKSRTHPLNHSLTQLISCPENRSSRFQTKTNNQFVTQIT